MKLKFSFRTPIGYSVAGSFFLHIFLVSVYGNLLTSREIPPPKKFKIEMVAKKAKPVKKTPVIEKKIVKPKMVTPIKIKKPHTPYSAQKIRKKEIALQPVPPMVPAKLEMMRENNAHPSKESFRMARADTAAEVSAQKPRTMNKLPTPDISTSRVQRTSTGQAKPTDISPLPRPVENVRIFSKVSDKETRFHASAVGFATPAPKPKTISVTSFSSSDDTAATRIHDDQKVLAHNLPQARARAVTETQPSFQQRIVKLKRGPSSPGLAPTPMAIRPAAPEFESVAAPDRAARFYEAQTRTVSTLPSARILSTSSQPNKMAGKSGKKSFVQKGELVATADFPSPRVVPDIVDPKILDGYLGTLQTLIASAKKYPESARKSGQEGKVTVKFTVLQNGEVKNVQLVSTTNYPELNEEAIEAVKRAAPFSDLPEEIGKSFLDIILPFKFKLNE